MDTGIVDSNPSQGMNVCCVVLCKGLVTGQPPIQGVLPNAKKDQGFETTTTKGGSQGSPKTAVTGGSDKE
jgi:hypothetical protein